MVFDPVYVFYSKENQHLGEENVTEKRNVYEFDLHANGIAVVVLCF